MEPQTQKKSNKRLPKNGSFNFNYDYKTEVGPKNLVDKATESAGKISKFEKIKPYKLTPQWVRLRLQLLIVQSDPWEKFFTVICKFMDKSTFTNCLISSQTWLPEKLAPNAWLQRVSKTLNFCPIFTACCYKVIEKTGFYLETESATRSTMYLSRKVINHSLQSHIRNFTTSCNFP